METSEAAPDYGVPAIPQPHLDIFKVSTPCELLKSGQLANRGVTKPGTRNENPTGPGCRWRSDDQVVGNSFNVALLVESKGLDYVYGNREELPVFIPTEVSGYPAVNIDGTDAKHGSCSTAVGVAQSLGFSVQVHLNKNLPEYTDPCSVSTAIAEIIVANLKETP